MENFERILEVSELFGKCPITGKEGLMKYRDNVKIRNPELDIQRRVDCEVCGEIHKVREVENLKISYKEDFMYIKRDEDD